MKDFEIVLEYLGLESENPLGCSRLAPLIIMINNREKIVKELLEESDFQCKSNLLCFLDSALRRFTKNIKEKNVEIVYTSIIYVLIKFSKLEEEKKWEINSEQFVEYLKGGVENE